MKSMLYKWILKNIGSKLPEPDDWKGHLKVFNRIRNRWARKIAPGISKKVNIHRGARIIGTGENLILEDYSCIGVNCVVESSLFIGEHTMMGPHCRIYTRNHVRNADCVFCGYEEKQVSIGHHSWLGYGVIILPGAKIGHHCTIAAGSVVPGKEYPDYALIAGNPAVVKKIYQ